MPSFLPLARHMYRSWKVNILYAAGAAMVVASKLGRSLYMAEKGMLNLSRTKARYDLYIFIGHKCYVNALEPEAAIM